MAKIVTITNPLTGQPAQVDQLDHTAQQIDDAIARAIPGGAIDIALANKLGGIESTDYPGCYYRTVDGAVEWFNPPMQLGGMDADGNPINEYRTTERYLGKPVYVICKPMGACAAGSEKIVNVGLSNVDYIIDCIGTADNIFALPHLHGVPGSADFNAYVITCWVQKTGGDDISAGYACGSSRSVTNANLIIKYTKTTD